MGRKALTVGEKVARKQTRQNAGTKTKKSEHQQERRRQTSRQAQLLSIDPLAPLSTDAVQAEILHENSTVKEVDPQDFPWPYPSEQPELEIRGTSGFEDEGDFLQGPDNGKDLWSEDGNDPQSIS